MRKFAYLRDGLFAGSCTLYAINRWVIRPAMPHSAFAWWFNDLLLIPCAAPVYFWIERKTGLRRHDSPPSAGELIFLLVLWSVLFEVIAPRFIPWTTGDWRDIISYVAGGVVAWAWWNRSTRSRASCVRPR